MNNIFVKNFIIFMVLVTSCWIYEVRPLDCVDVQ
nr:MAG TPA: Putative zinc- or iron-chelating domain [Caudoviricetes sp.]